MGAVHLDHPDETRWFQGWGPAPVAGPCPHADCPHERTGAIAYGPDFAHYVLDVCNEPDGCAGQCRGWFGEWPTGHVPRYRPVDPWLHVPVSKGNTVNPHDPEAGGYAWTEWLAVEMDADRPAEPADPPSPQEEKR